MPNPAETLRRAADCMRRERGAHPFYRAVADWLDWTAENGMERNRTAALPVARAYLGDPNA